MRPKPSKQFILFFLAFLILFNGTGLFLVSYIQIGIHRIHSQNETQDKSEQSLVLTAEEFSTLAWIGKRDFIWKGQAYDCISVVKEKSQVRILCELDHKESAMHRSLASHFENNKKNNTGSKSIRDIFKMLPVVPCSNNAVTILPSSCDFIALYEAENIALSSEAIFMNTPPPERI